MDTKFNSKDLLKSAVYLFACLHWFLQHESMT